MQQIDPEQHGERPIWQEPRPEEREGKPGEKSAGLDVGPVGRESGDEGDPAAVIWPEYQEGPETIEAEAEDADWADDDAEMEVEVDEDTFEEVDIDDEGEDEDE